MHNDTKINNVLFDRTTGEAVCVIDLDTVMPGFFIYDLGDMIRTFVCPVDENESNLDLITIRDDLRKLTEEAYVNELKDVLTREELKAIDFAGPMMTYIMAIRFLTDYLEGDQYFRTAYPEQNLFRARNQLKLLELLRTGAT
jgi:Ser/Thr protein kinase RdoA (MazF antagonist)